MPTEDWSQDRRNDYDVTNTVQVSSAPAVRTAVAEIFGALYPQDAFDSVWLAFHDFERLYMGRSPEYHAIDTSYHDMQHTLDMTLALARLISGYERTVQRDDRLGAERAEVALIAALFHDAGYLRHRIRDAHAVNGAEFTRVHVTRSGRMLEAYLPTVGLDKFVVSISRIVHFTGYEVNLDHIELDDPKDSLIGHLLGTSDLLAQLADRCYLEKCRDRLYPEFVIGGVAIDSAPTGERIVYGSGKDLLTKTLSFYQSSARDRLERSFNRVYRYMDAFFEGGDPYIRFIRKNLTFLTSLMRSGQWSKLRRQPPCVMPNPEGAERVMELARARLERRSNGAGGQAPSAPQT